VELTLAEWEPPVELTRLLEALAAEIAAATDGEVEVASTETVATARATLALVLRMRELIGDAITEPAEFGKQVLLPGLHVVSELRQRSH
jgi:hypothetical protein